MGCSRRKIVGLDAGKQNIFADQEQEAMLALQKLLVWFPNLQYKFSMFYIISTIVFLSLN